MQRTSSGSKERYFEQDRKLQAEAEAEKGADGSRLDEDLATATKWCEKCDGYLEDRDEQRRRLCYTCERQGVLGEMLEIINWGGSTDRFTELCALCRERPGLHILFAEGETIRRACDGSRRHDLRHILDVAIDAELDERVDEAETAEEPELADESEPPGDPEPIGESDDHQIRPGFWKRLLSRLFSRGANGVRERGLSEKDNVGTRYETHGKVESFWIPYLANRPKFPFIFYDMREKKDAMDAMLSLPPIRIAVDSGKLISTEVLQFGVYPNERGGWGFFLAGDQITPALYNAAIASCEKYNGTYPRVSDPPRGSATSTSSAGKANSSSVTFDWEEKVDMLRQMQARGVTVVLTSVEDTLQATQLATKRHYKGPSKDAALAFLKATPVDKPFYYLVVHTPDGVFCRDKDGVYEQPD